MFSEFIQFSYTLEQIRIGFPLDDSESRMFPAMHFLARHLNIRHLFKKIYRSETNLDQK